MAAQAVAREGDLWAGTCACGHPPGPYYSLPGVPIPVTGVIVGGSSTCTADKIPRARATQDMIALECGHVTIIIPTPSKVLLETGFTSVRVDDVVAGNDCGYPITGVIVSGSPNCVAG